MKLIFIFLIALIFQTLTAHLAHSQQVQGKYCDRNITLQKNFEVKPVYKDEKGYKVHVAHIKISAEPRKVAEAVADLQFLNAALDGYSTTIEKVGNDKHKITSLKAFYFQENSFFAGTKRILTQNKKDGSAESDPAIICSQIDHDENEGSILTVTISHKTGSFTEKIMTAAGHNPDKLIQERLNGVLPKMKSQIESPPSASTRTGRRLQTRD